MKKRIIRYFRIFIIITKETLSNPLRNIKEKNEFWEEEYIWLLILLIIFLIILIVFIVILLIKICTKIKKGINKNPNQENMVNSESSSQNYISEYNKKKTKIKKLKYKTRVIEDQDE